MSAARKADDDDSDGAVHRMDTLPPPAGEDDVYNAATRVGPMAEGLMAMMDHALSTPEASQLPPPASMTRDLALPRPARLPSLGGREEEVQRLYDAVERGNFMSSNEDAANEDDEPRELSLTPPRGSRRLSKPVVIQLKPVVDVAQLSLDDEAKTRRMELLIFLGALLLVTVLAAIAFFFWLG